MALITLFAEFSIGEAEEPRVFLGVPAAVVGEQAVLAGGLGSPGASDAALAVGRAVPEQGQPAEHVGGPQLEVPEKVSDAVKLAVGLSRPKGQDDDRGRQAQELHVGEIPLKQKWRPEPKKTAKIDRLQSTAPMMRTASICSATTAGQDDRQ